MASTAILAIRIVSDASKAAQGIDQTTTKVSKMSRAGDAAGRVLKYGFLAAAAGAVKLTGAAAADEQAQAKLAQSIIKAAGASDSQIAATEKWIEAQGKATGVTDDELRPALAKLVQATHDVGKAQELTALAQDVAVDRGKSLASVSDALAKAQNGQLGGLSRLGVRITKANGETKSLDRITKELAKTYGGAAARAADTAAGRNKILTTRMGELGEKIGAGLLPVMEKLTSAGIASVDWMTKHGTAAKVIIGSAVGLLVVIKALSVATTVSNGIQALSNATWIKSAAVKTADIAVMVAHKTATVASAAATKAAAAAQWLFNAAMAANPIGLIIIAVIALVAAIVIAYKRSETFRNIVQAVGRACATAFGWVIDKVRDLAGWVREKVPPAFARVRAVAIPILKAITTPTRFLISVIITLVKWIVGRWVAAFKIVKAVGVPVLQRIVLGAKIIIGVVAQIVGWVKTRLVAGFKAWQNVAGNVFDRVKAGIGFVIDKVSALATKVRDGLASVFGGLKDKAVGPINAIRDAFSGVYSMVQNAIDAVGWLIDKLQSVPGAGGGIPFVPGVRAMVPGQTTGRGATVINHITVNGILDGEDGARKIEQVLERRARRLGFTEVA